MTTEPQRRTSKTFYDQDQNDFQPHQKSQKTMMLYLTHKM